MKYRVFKAKRFRKSLKKMLRRGKDINKINDVILKLANGETLDPMYNLKSAAPATMRAV